MLTCAVAQGFALFEAVEVEVATGRRDSLDIKLSVALEKEEVTITAESSVSTEADNNASALVLRGAGFAEFKGKSVKLN